MKKHPLLAMGILILFSCLPGIAVYGQSYDIFIKLRDHNYALVPGGSTDAQHRNEIEALSFGQDNGTNSLFVFTMYPNKALNLLRRAMFSKMSFADAEIVVRKRDAGPIAEFYKVQLMQPSIVDLTDAINNTARPVIKVVMRSTLAGWQYYSMNADGGLDTPDTFGWDMDSNRPWNSAFGKAPSHSNPTNPQSTTTPPKNTTAPAGATTPTKVPAPRQEPIYTENFQTVKTGEFPPGWLTNGSGQVTTVKGQSGQWLEMVQHYVYTPELREGLPPAFTLDFDLVFKESKTQRSNFYLRILSQKNKEQFNPDGPYADLSFIGYNSLTIRNPAGNIQSVRAITQDSLSGKVPVSITKNKRRLILLLNGKKMFDIPVFFDEGNYNTLHWIAELSENSSAFISNIQVKKID